MTDLETYGIGLQSSSGEPLAQIDFELAAFRLNLDLIDEGKDDDIGLGCEQHFVNVTRILWSKGAVREFRWTAQTRMMLKYFIHEKVLTITGHARSSKTCLTSVWSLVLWLSEPDNMKAIVVSTEKSGAANRIWGQITDYYNAITRPPGRIYANGYIVPHDPTGKVKYSRRNGIELLAGNENKERESAQKLQGYHTGNIIPGRILVAVDEATGVAAGIFDAFFKNLSANPRARFIALGNFNRKESPFGRLCEPVGGWETVEPEDQFWRTSRGACIHLDGLQSDNWVAHTNGDPDPHPMLQSSIQVQGYYDRNEENTPAFWEMVRAFPAPVGIGDLGVYEPAELAMHKADQRVNDTAWKFPPTLWAGLDPAYVSKGDMPTIVPVRTGVVMDDWFIIEALEPVRVMIDAHGKPASHQILDFLYEWQQKTGCALQNIGYDCTHSAFGDIVKGDERFGKLPYGVQFSGAGASDAIIMKVGDNAGILRNNERFGNRVTELWLMGRDFMRAGQLRGIVGAIHSEMCKRLYDDPIHRNGKTLLKVESKEVMKKRTKGKSPDAADAFFIALATIIKRLHLRAGAIPLTPEEAEEKRKKALLRGIVVAPKLRGATGARSSLTINGMFDFVQPRRGHKPQWDPSRAKRFL